MIYVGVLLACLWSAGCFALPLWAAYAVWNDYERGMAIAILCLGWPLGCVGGLIPWMLVAEAQSPDLATLKKNEWICSAQHTVVTTTMMMSGKVMVPITSSHQVCDQYNRR